VTKKVAEDRSFVEMIEKPGNEVYFLNSIELEKLVNEDSKRRAKLFADIIKKRKRNNPRGRDQGPRLEILE
jgi:hypothetical protein